MPPLYTVIIPSRGDRPMALAYALDSIKNAYTFAQLQAKDVEILIAFDGVKGDRVRKESNITYYDLPSNHDFGNALRHALIKAAHGHRLIFHDDDNILTSEAFTIYEAHKAADMLIARIDVSKAHTIAYLPIDAPPKPIIRPCNIDPLCLCLTKELVLTRCGGWLGTKYEADYENILRYWRRAQNVHITDDVVGIYDAGRGLDVDGLNFRQRAFLAKNG